MKLELTLDEVSAVTQALLSKAQEAYRKAHKAVYAQMKQAKKKHK